MDSVTGELRHGLLEHSADNLRIERDAGAVWLVANVPLRLVEEPAPGSERSPPADRSAAGVRCFNLVSLDGAEFGLESGKKYLSAEPDGRVTLFRDHCRDWERFHVRPGCSEVSGTVVELLVDDTSVRFFINDRQDVVQRQQCRGDFYERSCLNELKKVCRPDRAFVDIGANVGNHAVFVSKFCSVREILVFEPNPKAISLLKINLALNACDNVDQSYLGLALASESGRFRLFQPHADNLGGTQLVEADDGAVRSAPGDEILLHKPVGVLKIDVEGMEFRVLAGLARTIERWRPAIFVEVWRPARADLFAWCSVNGYAVADELINDNYLLLPGPRDAPG